MPVGAVEVFLLASGLVLLGSELERVPKVGDDLKKLAHWLSGFGVFIGVIDVVLFILALF